MYIEYLYSEYLNSKCLHLSFKYVRRETLCKIVISSSCLSGKQRHSSAPHNQPPFPRLLMIIVIFISVLVIEKNRCAEFKFWDSRLRSFLNI